ncbi:MAG: transcriptional regulator [Flavobacteriales bacterium]|nr:transcriptional regulator [Flavobacteriales bacterium]MCB9166832.1 transcriptional regulator [Flavobacteriales bacterium]MCB9170533.1 transcriptional regulator [Flavobacteriales bacterium]
MTAKLIKTKKEHQAALARVHALMQQRPASGSRGMDELELLALLVSEYEEEHFPIPPPDPIEAIKFRIDQLGLQESELDKILGSRQRRSDIFNGRRKLSLGMIRALHQKLRIPAETLIRDYKVKKKA